MSVGKLEFNLNDPEEKKAYMRALKATNAYQALWMIEKGIRTKNAYLKDSIPEDEYKLTIKILDDVMDTVFNAMCQNDIHIYEELL
jgi:hypothetical protein